MKFAADDREYFDRARHFSTKYGPRELWSVIHHWPLYCGIGNLARFMAIGDLVREQLDVPGDFAEFGSWRGANLLFMAKLLRIYDPHGSKVTHCFDSFEGLSEFGPQDRAAAGHAGEYKGSLEELRDLIALYQLQDDVIIHKGLIEKTLTAVLETQPQLTFSLVFCDTDLYGSTKTILDSLHTRLVKGGVFVLDEWNNERFPGEGTAANEFLAERGQHYSVHSVRAARQPTLVLKKLTY
jgi:hypothetical protein